MFSNYHYFLVLAEECNITRAASRLFITHQNLSRYLSNLEKECGVTLFERKPTFSLTHAGELMLETMQQVALAESNLRAHYVNLRGDKSGKIALGTSEGRFRILIPNIVSAFKEQCPDITLRVVSATSSELREMLMNNSLDFIIAAVPEKSSNLFAHSIILQEHFYLIISRNMLHEYFGENFTEYVKDFQKGVDLRMFQDIPFSLNMPTFNSSILLSQHLEKIGAKLNCIHTSNHPDLHHQLSARDYAASICLTMYLPGIFQLNESQPENPLYVFPIKEFDKVNPVAITYINNRIFPYYTNILQKMIRLQCERFSQYDLLVNDKRTDVT